MTRAPAYLAALASSAVSGLDPVAVRASRGLPGNRCEVAFVTDTQRRAWVVRVPTTPAVGAQLDAAVPLLGLIARRLPFQVPSPRGFVGVPDGRAVVYPFLHGRSVVLEEVPPGPGVAAELGRAVAALHNVDRAVFEEAGVAVYDAETYRSRHLADLDRAAATGHVPTALLSRWERALEDVSAWRFAPTPVHGDVRGGRVLVSFAQEDDPTTATVRGITGWEHAKVADPADDLAAFAAECSPETFESICEAYAVARIERPDRHLRLRARLAAELRALAGLLDAVTAAEPLLITRRAAELRALDERTADLPDLVAPPPVEPEPVRPVAPMRGAAAAAPDGERSAPSDGPDALERDESQDTQRLRVGDAAGATTVIPAEELSRLRAVPASSDEDDSPAGDDAPDRVAAAGDAGEDRTDDAAPEGDGADGPVVVVPVSSEVVPDDSWYQVIEPIAPPEDEVGPADRTTNDVTDSEDGTEATVVLVENDDPRGDEGDEGSTGDEGDEGDEADASEERRGSEPSEGGGPGDAGPETPAGAATSETPGSGDPASGAPGSPVSDPAATPAPATQPARRHRRATRP